MRIRSLSVVCSIAASLASFGCSGTVQSNLAKQSPTPSQPPATPQAAPVQITTTQLPPAASGAAYSASLTATGGTPPYVWSLASGVLPDGLTLSGTGEISGQPTAATQAAFTVVATDSGSTPVMAQASLSLDVAANPSTTTPATTTTLSPAGYYGGQIGGDSLANTTVGPGGNTVSYRFSAQHNGALQKLRFYIIPDHTGYAAGTGGKLQVTVQTDDGTSAHNPSGTVLASTLLSNVLSVSGSARYFPLVTFSTPPTLTAGKLYHIVFKNVDSSPSVNYMSVDCLWYTQAITPTQPTLSDAANAVLLHSSGSSSWGVRKGYTPISELYYSNGNTQGIGYVEAFVAGPQTISGTSAVRETFTVTGASKTIATVAVRAARASGSDYLKVRLENSDGTLIEEGLLPASSFPQTSPVSHTWAQFNFASTHILQTGKSYNLILETPASSQYVAFSMQKGTAYGFDNSTYFPDGHAEMKVNGGSWTGWSVWGVNNRMDSDLQFYFGVVQ